MIDLKRRNFLTGTLATGVVAAAALFPASRTFAKPAAPSGITESVMQRALAAFERHSAHFSDRRMIAIADFSLSSAMRRFHIVDMASGEASPLLVAHGRGSDPDHSGWVQSFSNIHGSEATSSGTYVTGQSYVGQHGRSRRLLGLDPENDAAEARAIVIHPAWYVSAAMVAERGKIGRSQGCFAFSEGDIDQVLSRLPEGCMLYADKV